MSDSQASASTFTFGIRRLVLVDSAGFCYVEIPVDNHGLILGPGNLGKSSLLNSLRLFLLPENNFKNSRKKFAFRNASAGSFYTNEESYQHYFPSQFSFLIMEAENPAGSHCQILYRDNASRLSYGRAFVPVSYDQLRPLFWNGDDEDGIGQAVPELSFTRLSEALKKLSKETRLVNDPAKLKTMLYSSELMNADAVRYSVLPLGESDERRVQSLRTLILLLFEMKADDQAMANAVASIIEADKKFADDAFDFNIDDFLNRHDQLKQLQSQLNRIEKERHRFEKLNRDYQAYQTLLRSQHEFAAFRDGVTNALADIAAKRRVALEAFNDQNDTLRHVLQTLKKLEQEASGLKGEIRSADRRIKQAEQSQKDGELLISQYGDMTLQEIAEIQTEELESKKGHLAALKSAAHAEIRLEQIQRKKQDLERKLESLEDRESKQQWQLQNQLDETTAAPLRAVDPRLMMASPGQDLDADSKATIEAFARLFAPNDRGFDWFDTEYENQPARHTNFAEQRHYIEGELHGLEKERSELADTANQEHDRPQLIERTDKEIRSIEKDLETLQRYPAAATTLRDATEEKKAAEEQLAKLDEQARLEQEKQDAVQAKATRAKAEKDRTEERERELAALSKSVGTVEHRFPHLRAVEAEQPLDIDRVSAAAFDALQSQLDDLEERRRNILDHLRQFVYLGIHEDTEGELQKDSPASSVIRSTFKSLSDLFAGMAERWSVLEQQVGIHNETVASYRQALKSNHEHIARFEAQLNRELDGVRINDLVEIRVDIHTDPKFRNLVEEANNIDPYGNQLQSDAFYDRLRVFVADFFGEQGGSKRLTMDKVITGISYRTRKENAANLDRKGQSTSTTALINLELVYRLLKRVLYPGVRLSFPMVLDELASVDISQMPSLLERLRKQGFNLFSAATHSASAEVIYLIGRHLEVGQMRTARPYSKERTLVFWGGAEGFTGGEPLSHWADQTQSSLLEPVDE
ncbi:hypothetical protein [Marinobacter nauticus]|uniref:hypothetical protein n=1 Tax=Marinobacter nauticus TaxID=2743 RepID=UPI001C96933E|nr:hypothetical protein [Marinobacter nauticus]MBY5938897.1 hypothetical protein [Marinobacter nauticus]MBY5956126.1 hypothetical protein [Marinobacter nauticus]MBY6009917.1 hypothetical protein [Marinobacter nauticus]MBY6104816.1 hypothetical protein [Marinobacter nauticus]